MLRAFLFLAPAGLALDSIIPIDGAAYDGRCSPGEIVRVALINNRSVPTGVWFYPPTGGGRRSPDALDPGSSLSADVPCQSLFVFVIPQTESEHAKSAAQSHPPDGTVLHRVPVTQAHAQKIVASRPVLRDVTAYQFRLRRYGERPEYSPGRQYYVSRTEEVAPAATREWFSRAVRADEDGFDDRECLIPRLRNSSTDEFQERCVHASRPCLLQLRGRDVFETETEAWMPPEAWSRKSFSTNHGGLPVRRTFGSDLTRGAFLANFESASERETLAEYLSSASDEVVFEYGCPKCDDLSEALRGSWSAPRVFEGPRKKRLVSIGGDGASLNFHAHGAAWLLLVHGKKQWYLAPPGLLTEEELADSAEMRELDRSRLRARRAFQSARPASVDRLEVCVQHAGELLYIPEGWQHATVNIGEAVAVGEQTGVVDEDAMYETARRTAARNADYHGSPMGIFSLQFIAAKRAMREAAASGRSADRELAELRRLVARQPALWLQLEERLLDARGGIDDVRFALDRIAQQAEETLGRSDLAARKRAREADFASAALFDVAQPTELHDVARACNFSARAHALAPSADRSLRLALCELEASHAASDYERAVAYSRACKLLNQALAREPGNGVAFGLLSSVAELRELQEIAD